MARPTGANKRSHNNGLSHCETKQLSEQNQRTLFEAVSPIDGGLRLKLDLIDAAHRTFGRKAAAALWRQIGLPLPTDAPAPEPPPAVADFLAEAISPDADGRVRALALFEHYLAWCRSGGRAPMTLTAFGRSMRRTSYVKRPGRHTYYLGLALSPPGPRTPEDNGTSCCDGCDSSATVLR
jgi:hypothetical protein